MSVGINFFDLKRIISAAQWVLLAGGHACTTGGVKVGGASTGVPTSCHDLPVQLNVSLQSLNLATTGRLGQGKEEYIKTSF